MISFNSFISKLKPDIPFHMFFGWLWSKTVNRKFFKLHSSRFLLLIKLVFKSFKTHVKRLSISIQRTTFLRVRPRVKRGLTIYKSVWLKLTVEATFNERTGHNIPELTSFEIVYLFCLVFPKEKLKITIAWLILVILLNCLTFLSRYWITTCG